MGPLHCAVLCACACSCCQVFDEVVEYKERVAAERAADAAHLASVRAELDATAAELTTTQAALADELAREAALETTVASQADTLVGSDQSMEQQVLRAWGVLRVVRWAGGCRASGKAGTHGCWRRRLRLSS